MEHAELERIGISLDKARSPEEVFGAFTGSQAEMLEAVRRVFRQMAKVVHPDVYQGTADFEQAGALFKKLTHFWELAQRRIENGTYGTAGETFTPFLIATKSRQYMVERLLARSELWGFYLGSYRCGDEKMQGILKVPLRPEDNDLLSNEARILGQLRVIDGYEKRRHFVSQLVDAFAYQEQASGILRQVNVFSYVEGLYTLKEVREAYPQGIDARDMAWIWRRLLVALGFAHANAVIHGGVLPTHVLLHPRLHGVVLTDWSCAVHDPAVTGEYICAISSAYRAWYPAEVFTRGEPTPGLDIALAARCMIDLLGGDPVTRLMPESVPWQIQNHLKGCTLPKPQQRPQDARILLREFDELIERLWGPRTFREFTMPKP
jgi:hypothetical protein